MTLREDPASTGSEVCEACCGDDLDDKDRLAGGGTGRALGRARGRCAVAGRDVWVEADGPGSVAVQETTVKTGAANTTVSARRVGRTQRPAPLRKGLAAVNGGDQIRNQVDRIWCRC